MEKNFDVTDSSYPGDVKNARCHIICGDKADTIRYSYRGDTRVKRVDVASMVMPVIRDGGLTVIHGDDVDLYSYHDTCVLVAWYWDVPAGGCEKVANTIHDLSELFDDALDALMN